MAVVLNGEGLAQHWHRVVDMGVSGLPRHRHWQTCLKTSTSLLGFALGLSNFARLFSYTLPFIVATGIESVLLLYMLCSQARKAKIKIIE